MQRQGNFLDSQQHDTTATDKRTGENKDFMEQGKKDETAKVPAETPKAEAIPAAKEKPGREQLPPIVNVMNEIGIPRYRIFNPSGQADPYDIQGCQLFNLPEQEETDDEELVTEISNVRTEAMKQETQPALHTIMACLLAVLLLVWKYLPKIFPILLFFFLIFIYSSSTVQGNIITTVSHSLKNSVDFVQSLSSSRPWTTWSLLKLKSDEDVVKICVASESPTKIFFKLSMGGVDVTPQVDTGAELSLATEDLFRMIPGHESLPIHPIKACLIDHNQRPIRQVTEPRIITYRLGDKVFQHPTYIIDNGITNSFLVGMDMLNAQRLSLLHDGTGYRMVTGDPLHPDQVLPTLSAPLPPELPEENCLRLQEDLFLQPAETRLVACRADKPVNTNRIALEHPNNETAPYVVIPTVDTVSLQDNYVEISNRSMEQVQLPKNWIIGKIEDMQEQSPRQTSHVETEPSVEIPVVTPEMEEMAVEPPSFSCHTEYFFDFKTYLQDSSFPEELLEDFLNFIDTKANKVIACSEFDFGKCTLPYEMEIETITDEAVSAKPYRLDPISTQQLDKILARMVEAGILSKEPSNFTSPVFLIGRKGEGGGSAKIRVLIDYRAINSLSVKDRMPLPYIPRLMQQLQNATWFSSLDLKHAFYAIPMSKEAGKKAAFVTHNATYVPRRMMMGLSTSANIFARVIQEVLEPVSDYALHFQDDLLIFTNGSKEDHLNHLKKVFLRLQECGLKCNGKGAFFKKEIAFLGKIVTKNGLKPHPKHVSALTNFPRPTCKKDLQKFIGIVNWLAPFILQYSQKINHLCQLISSKEWEWTRTHEEAFQQLKEQVNLNTFLYFVDTTLPLYVASDISHDSFGCIAYQVVSYAKEDLPKLKKATMESSTFPPSSIPTSHPVLPSSGAGVPEPLPLQAKGKGTTSHRIAAAHDIHPDLTEIMQENDKVHHVRAVGYFSGLFRGATLNYTTVEKEMTGLLLGMENFKHMCYMTPACYVITDSQPLVWLLKFRQSGLAKLERACIRLLAMPYQLIVCHLKGSLHPCDLLTRIFKVQEPAVRLKEAKKAVVVKTPWPLGSVVTLQDIIKELEKDPGMVEIPDRAPTKQTRPQEQANIIAMADGNRQEIKAASLATVTHDLEKELTPEKIAEAQARDPELKELRSQLLDGKHVKGYSMENGLVKKARITDQDKLIVIPSELQPLLFAAYHVVNHSGAGTLARMIGSNYHVPNLKDKLVVFTLACSLCNRFKASCDRKVQLGSAPLPTRKGESWTIDIVEGFPPTHGYDAYLSILDTFSGFRIALICQKTITAPKICQLLRENIIQVFGVPSFLTSDGGPQMLKSKELTEFCRFYSISRHVGVPNSPKSHGRIEISNRYISELTNILADQFEVPWTKIIHYCIHQLNLRPRKYFGDMSPMTIMFGTDQSPALPQLTDDIEAISPERHKELFETIHKKCDELIKSAQKEMQERNRALGGISNYVRPGSCVYLRDFRILPKKKTKQKFHSAPVLVLADYGETLLTRNFLGITSVVHKSNTRIAHPREVELFDKLPATTKAVLGAPFSPKEIEQAV